MVTANLLSSKLKVLPRGVFWGIHHTGLASYSRCFTLSPVLTKTTSYCWHQTNNSQLLQELLKNTPKVTTLISQISVTTNQYKREASTGLSHSFQFLAQWVVFSI